MRTSVCTILLALASAPAAADTFTVTRGDDPVPAPACATGDCTLRAAILAVNGNAGADTIAFNIAPPASGTVVTITPSAPLPAITGDATTIDGFTQAGAAAGTSSTIRFNSTIKVHLKGSPNEFGLPDGLELSADGTLITGLAISHFDTAIVISGSGNTIRGNLIGIGPNGELEMPPSPRGIWIRNLDIAPRNNTIGTTALPNVIAGVDTGVFIDGAGGGTTQAEENRVQNNYFGIGPDGVAVLPLATGVLVSGATNARIGRNVPANFTEGNQFGGAGVDAVGVEVVDSNLVAIDDNLFGAASSAEVVLHPIETGIYLRGASNDVTIQYNTFRSIRGNGIELAAGSPAPQRVILADNRILSVGGLPIDLGGDGPTPNDPLDADSGPNGLLNTLSNLTYTVAGDTVTVNGTLASTPNTTFFVDLVSARHPGAITASGGPIADGFDYLFTDPPQVTTDANGNGTFQIDVGRFELFDRFVPGAVVVAASGSSEMRRSTPTGAELATPSCVTFDRLLEHNIDRPVAREVEIRRFCNTTEAASVTVRSNGPGTTNPAIGSSGLVLNWAAFDASSRFITLIYNGPQTELRTWSLTLSNPVATIIDPFSSYYLLLAQPEHQPWPVVDHLFGDLGGGGSMENPGRK